MRYISKTVVTLLLLVQAIGAAAQQSGDPMHDIISVILDNSPSLQSQRAQLASSILTDRDGNSLSNPEVSVARVWGRNGIGNKLQIDVSQTFEWPDVYRLRSQATRQGEAAAQLLIAADALDMALEAKLLMIELVSVRRSIAIKQDLIANMDKLSQAMDTAFKKGYVSVLDHKKMSIDAYTLQLDLATLQARESEITAQIQGMCPMALDLTRVQAYPIEPLYGIDEYVAQIEQLDPRIAAMKMTSDQELTAARAAQRGRLPQFTVGYQHQAEMGDRFNGFTLGMTLPVFEGRHAKAAAQGRSEAALSEADALMAEKEAQMRADYQAVQLWKGKVEAYNQALGDKTYLNLLYLAYTGGELSILEYLTEMRFYSDAAMAWTEAEYAYQSALARLNAYAMMQ